jgi:hypothetical protein
MCCANAVVSSDEAGNRKLNKKRARWLSGKPRGTSRSFTTTTWRRSACVRLNSQFSPS